MPQSFRLSEIAKSLGLTVVGDGALPIRAVAEPADAREDHLALAMKPAYAEALPKGRAKAAMLWAGADWQALGLSGAILPERPRFALAGLSALMDPGQGYAPGIHPTAIIEDGADLAPDVSVGAFSVIGRGAAIGAGSVIASHVQIGADVTLGPLALIHSGVRLLARVRIGARCILHPNVVIGGDGFSFVTPEPSTAEAARAERAGSQDIAAQPWSRIHSLGAVTIGDDVEIGANSTVDRGTVRDTQIGSGTKIDNLVQVGHNVVIGRDCMLCSQAGVAGSTVLGDGVVMGGKSGASDNIRIGDRVVLGGASIVLSNVPAGRVMLGYPATKMDVQLEAAKGLRRLPRLFRDVAALKKAVLKSEQSD